MIHGACMGDYLSWCSLLIHVKYDWSRSSCTNSFARGSTSLTHLLPPSLSHASLSPSPPSSAVSLFTFSSTVGVVSWMRTLQWDFNSASSDTIFLTSDTTLCHSLAPWSDSIPDSCKNTSLNHTTKPLISSRFRVPQMCVHVPSTMYIHILYGQAIYLALQKSFFLLEPPE